MTNKEIAHELGIAEVTVKNHTTFAYQTLGAQSAVEAFLTLGWLVPPPVEEEVELAS
jgi:DNA-binding NarL/FixJ family response regulator